MKNGLLKRLYGERYSFMFIAPFMLLFMLFTVIPAITAMILSLTDYNMLQAPNFVGLSNYRSLFITDDVFRIAVKNTLLLAFITGPMGYVMCFGLAWFINELPRRIKAVMTFIFYAPSITGSAYIVWRLILSGDRYGYLNSILINLRINDFPIIWLYDTRYMMGAVIVVQLWLSLGTSFLAFLAGFKTADTNLYEAAAIDGIKNRFQELIYVTLPQMKPMLLFGAIMQIAGSFAIGAVPTALTGFPSTDYATHTVITHINDYGSIRYEMGYASAISTVLLVFMLMVNKAINAVLKE